jgi:hypothetical protein
LSLALGATEVYGQKESIGMSESLSVQVIHSKNQTQSNTNTANTAQSGSGQNVPHGTEGIPGQFSDSYQVSSASSDNTFVVATEHHLYEPRNEVNLKGTIWPGLISTVGGINNVSIKVTDDNEVTLYSSKIVINTDGGFQSSFRLPSDLRQGEYKIDAKADVNQDVLNSLTFKMQAGLGGTTKFIVASPIYYQVDAGGKEWNINMATNSNVTNFKFDESAKIISFTVQGKTGIKGVLDIVIPKGLLDENFIILIDGQEVPNSDVILTSDSQNQTTIEINYEHTSHEIKIAGTSAIPEFPLSAALAIFSAILFLSLLQFKSLTKSFRYF